MPFSHFKISLASFLGDVGDIAKSLYSGCDEVPYNLSSETQMSYELFALLAGSLEVVSLSAYHELARY